MELVNKFFAALDRIHPLVPGVLLAVCVAGVSRLLALVIPNLGGATIAILLGILLGNTFFKQESLQVGTKFSESKLLEISVVLLGATVTFQTITQIGWQGVLFIVLQMTITIFAVLMIGSRLHFPLVTRLLMAGGNAVCGSSAIASIAPVIGAKEEQKGQIITLVNLMGTVMMLTLPFIGSALFGGNLLAKSALIGGTLQSVGQVVAGASMLGADVVQYATLFKIMRIMLLVVVVYAFKKIAQNNQKYHGLQIKNKEKSSFKLPLPWYVLGFLLFCILNSLIELPAIIDTGAHFISGWFEIIALAAIGLRLDFRKFIKEGPRFLIYGLSVGSLQTVLALILIFALGI